LCAEIGQPFEAMTTSRRAMVADAAGLIVEAERVQAAQARGEATDPDSLVRMSNALSRAIDALGLSPTGQEARRAAEAEAERKRLLNQHYPGRKWE
jgi:hypothetical protein